MSTEPRVHSIDHTTEIFSENLLIRALTGEQFPEGFEENDLLRSEFMRQLTYSARLAEQSSNGHSRPEEAVASDSSSIPRTLVRFWHDVKSIPADVQVCLDSWAPLVDEGMTFRMFDDDTAATYIADRYGELHAAAFARCGHPAMRSDYLRLCFVLAEGGLYVDADDVLLDDGWRRVFRDDALKLQPLCYDIPDGRMIAATELGLLDSPTSHRIFYVNNNPIAAPPGDPVVARALARATRLLLGDVRVYDIQSTTGPGNLTAALAAHTREELIAARSPCVDLLFDWESTAEPDWSLEYRRDSRNWRNWSVTGTDRQAGTE